MQTRKTQAFRLIIVMGMMVAVFASNLAYAGQKPGFILLAPDRGFMGNNEIRKMYKGFQESVSEYPSRLVFASRVALSTYLQEAVGDLESDGATKIVVIPLFLSGVAPELQRARSILSFSAAAISSEKGDGVVKGKLPLQFAPTLSASYLTAQILEDRARELSETPSEERLIVLGAGASDEDEVEKMTNELQVLTKQVQRKMAFKETLVFVFPHSDSDQEESRRAEIVNEIKRLSALEGKTLVVPFVIGMKLTPMMSTENMLGRFTLRGLEINYSGKSILPHANVARWLKKTANRYLPATRENIGVVFMNHGSFYYHNEKVRQVAKPAAEKYKLEYAMGMADPFLIQEAVSRLEARGATHIIVLRVFSLTRSFKKKTEYILGLNDALSENNRMGPLPDRVRSSAIFYTAGGVDDDPLLAEVLLERAQSISNNPQKETVILVAHGLGNDQGDENWRKLLRSLAAQMHDMSKDKFEEIKVATWREDWPDKRKKAVDEIKTMIQQAQQNGGRALVVASRLEGNGPANELLKGIEYAYNGEGFSGHPNFSRWIEEKIAAALVKLQADYLTFRKQSATRDLE